MDNKSIESGLSDEQRAAVADLARTNEYAKQSKWKTLRELPNNEKLPFFVQHFLIATIAIVAVVALVISLVVFYATRPPSAKLTVATFGLSEYSDQLEDLRRDFAAAHADEDERVFAVDPFTITSRVNADESVSASPSASASSPDGSADAGGSGDMTGVGSSSLLGNSYLDDSAKLSARMAAGEINALAASRDMFAELLQRNAVNDLSAALSDEQINAFGDAVVYADDLVPSAEHRAVGLDLGKSGTWTAKGLPADAVFGFGNVTLGTEWPLAFVDFLKFQ
ncbi:hypothetical protein [Bifidobacterium avesanii]|uniref:hypothetical protein n=1 Tax=Bifidobacterium avesanii TaxID=1798157 RepID=UPI0013856FB2|nr:hypothetical protein [Bifidobacterium avesanii]KAB8291017.1 hypothetical protein DSM100685_1279 [Bifidobacterium avesanii]